MIDCSEETWYRCKMSTPLVPGPTLVTKVSRMSTGPTHLGRSGGDSRRTESDLLPASRPVDKPKHVWTRTQVEPVQGGGP